MKINTVSKQELWENFSLIEKTYALFVIKYLIHILVKQQVVYTWSLWNILDAIPAFVKQNYLDQYPWWGEIFHNSEEKINEFFSQSALDTPMSDKLVGVIRENLFHNHFQIKRRNENLQIYVDDLYNARNYFLWLIESNENYIEEITQFFSKQTQKVLTQKK
jgi:hypothetical protein